jgi:hypothetical protein
MNVDLGILYTKLCNIFQRKAQVISSITLMRNMKCFMRELCDVN